MTDQDKGYLDQINDFRLNYISPFCDGVQRLPQLMTDFKEQLFFSPINEKNRFRGLLLLTLFSTVGSRYVLIATGRFQHTFRNSVMYFYGYGFIIYPELYNSWFRIARVHLPPQPPLESHNIDYDIIQTKTEEIIQVDNTQGEEIDILLPEPEILVHPQEEVIESIIHPEDDKQT